MRITVPYSVYALITMRVSIGVLYKIAQKAIFQQSGLNQQFEIKTLIFESKALIKFFL